MKMIIYLLSNLNYKTMKTSQQLTEEAIEQVKKNNLAYYFKALLFAENWVKNQYKEFTSEDLKDAYYLTNDPPQEGRIWGAIIRTMSNNHLIYKHGYGTYKSPKGHGKPVVIWISHEFRKKQQSNAMKNKKQERMLFM